ncbi:MAG: hypothetical protein MI806_17185 [Minwuiales bacterium]|nr:hypothetical protein [Minwuiales bacterium]
MNDQTQRKVIALFDEGKLPQQIADDLDISMHSVIDALKRRLRLVDDEVHEYAEREQSKEAAMEMLKGRLRVVDEEQTEARDRATPATLDGTAEHVPSSEEFLSDTSPLDDTPWSGEEREPGVRLTVNTEVEAGLLQICRANLAGLEPGLVAVGGEPGLRTSFGKPDILAKDRYGAPVIIQFMVDDATPEAITRILGLIASVQERGQQPVRGILVARGFPEMVRYAARAVPNVELKTYRTSISFADA